MYECRVRACVCIKGGYSRFSRKCQYFRESWNIQDPHPRDRIYYYIMLSNRRLNLERGDIPDLNEVPVLQRELEYPRPTPYRSNLLLHHAIESKIKLRKGGYSRSQWSASTSERAGISDHRPIESKIKLRKGGYYNEVYLELEYPTMPFSLILTTCWKREKKKKRQERKTCININDKHS